MPLLNNVLNAGKKIDVQNTYSIGSSGSSKSKNISTQMNSANNINNNELDVSNKNNITKLRSNTSENRGFEKNISDIAQNRQSNAPNREINELKESVKNIEKDQVQDIEETNATIAQNRGALGSGARLINNFFTNLSPNVGGKVDTIA
ncbi:hypothetical protein ACFL40_05875 [candidate division KSB1 bacterium]